MDNRQTITVRPSGPNTHTVALIALLCVCVFWGSTFPLMKEAMEATRVHLDALGAQEGAPAGTFLTKAEPMLFLGLRFIIASLLMPLILIFDRKPGRKLTLRAATVSSALAVLFTGSFFLQVYGLQDVPPSLSAFVTSLFVVFTPLVVWVFMRKRPSWRLGVAVAIALAGVGLISLSSGSGSDSTGPSADTLLTGILLSLGCAAGFACHLTYTDYVTKRFDPLIVSIVMMIASAILTLACLPLVLPINLWIELTTSLLSDWAFLRPLLITTIFATVLAVYAWNRWQKELGASRAAVLYTMEPVFASAISIALGYEDFRWMLLAGACMVVGANVWCELRAAKAAQEQR